VAYVSPGASRLLGRRSRKGARLVLRDTVDERWRATFDERWAALLAGRPVPDFEYSIVTPSGEARWLRQHAVVAKDRSGTPTSFQVVLRDITGQRNAEEALRASEERFRVAFRTLPEAVNLNRLADGCFVDINDGFTSLTGFTRREVIGRTSADVGIWRDLRDRERLAAALRSSGRVTDMEAEFRGKDGRIRLGAMSARLLSIAGEAHILSITRDITDRREADERLRRSQAQLQAVLCDASLVLWAVDAEGVFTLSEGHGLASLGLSPGELVGQSVFDFYRGNPDIVRDVRRALQGEPAVVVHEVGSMAFETRLTPALDPAGGRSGVIGVSVDISNRRRAEESLHQQALIFDNLTEAVVVADMGFRLIEWNAGAEKLFGHSRDEALGRDFLMFAAPSSADGGEHRLLDVRAALEREPRWSGELPFVAKGRAGGTVELTIVPLNDSRGSQVGWLAVGRDTTERRQLERQFLQAQKMEAVGRLAGGVAHDFNNLLTAIQGNVALATADLAEAARDPSRLLSVQQFLDDTGRAVQRAASLTRRLLSFSRKQVVRRERLDLNVAVEDARQMLQRLIGEDVELQTDLSPGLGATRADPVQIGQVIVNLAVNARDAMPRGGRLLLETRNVDIDSAVSRGGPGLIPGRYVLLAVADTGLGMDRGVRSHLFEPFFTTKEPGRGTGLGLATVYGIVRDAGGTILVESEPGSGARFEIYLPRLDAQADEGERGPVE
jgi:PAS domain S-box-containing protein